MTDEISDTLAEIIADDPAGPFPETGQQIRCFLKRGWIIDGTVSRVWLDLDTVRIDVWPGDICRCRRCVFRITPAEGDFWEPAGGHPVR
jgi:hypothetical protein